MGYATFVKFKGYSTGERASRRFQYDAFMVVFEPYYARCQRVIDAN
ncbi:hypothetical protein EDF74_2280 [Stenotrophomonas rhizophila]|nr:hypothetical protein EDF74_2280 [Stenotrophomonas rhizophila]